MNDPSTTTTSHQDDNNVIDDNDYPDHEPSLTTLGSSSTPNHRHQNDIVIAFGVVGLLNNCAYVIMLANAKYISEGGVAAVYIANILPGLLVQITAPYWFDVISYQVRLRLAAISMALAFLMVSYFSYHPSDGTYSTRVVLTGQLLGVALISFQCGLGEASLLALAGKWDSHSNDVGRRNMMNDSDNHADDRPLEHNAVDYDRNRNSNNNSNYDTNHQNTTKTSKGHCLSAFAMGTGIAGPAGFLWKIAWNEWIGVSVSVSLLIAAMVLSVVYGIVCTQLVSRSLGRISPGTTEQYSIVRSDAEETSREYRTALETIDETMELYQPPVVLDNNEVGGDGLIRECNDSEDHNNIVLPLQEHSPPVLPALADLSVYDRFRLLMRMCWVYMIPLFVVYAAEYACQAGAWTAIGFPTVTDEAARTQFYERSNWLYQAGVFISRSTGSFCTINIVGLWIMPAIQVLNLIIFSMAASTGIQVPRSMFYHQSTLLSLSFFTGLLGGAVYVHGYNRIVRDVPKQYTEFAVASTSVAVSFGVLMADIIGLYLQSCLYRSNGLDGATVQCPL